MYKIQTVALLLTQIFYVVAFYLKGNYQRSLFHESHLEKIFLSDIYYLNYRRYVEVYRFL